MATPRQDLEPAKLVGNLPPGAVVPVGRQRPRWRRRLKWRNRSGRWFEVDRMAPRSAYQTALSHNRNRALGVDWELACMEPDDGSQSILYARWAPVTRRVTKSEDFPVE